MRKEASAFSTSDSAFHQTAENNPDHENSDSLEETPAFSTSDSAFHQIADGALNSESKAVSASLEPEKAIPLDNDEFDEFNS